MSLGGFMFGVWVFLGLITVWRTIVVFLPSDDDQEYTRIARIAVAGLFGAAFLSNTFNRPEVAMLVNEARPGLSQILGYSVLMFFFAGFVCFFASGIYGKGSFLSSWRIQAAIPATASLLLVGVWLLIPVEVGFPSFDTLRAGGPVRDYAGYMILQAYCFYGTAVSAILAWRAGSGRPNLWRWTFRSCATGMAMCFVGGPLLLTVALVAKWETGADFGPVYTATRTMVNFAGIVTLLVGLSLVAARGFLAHLWSLVQTKRHFLVLRPLWLLLYQTYPGIALYKPRSGLRDLLVIVPSSIEYRFRRRTIECRDGLWRLSPYVAEPEDGTDGPQLSIEQQARLVVDAAARVRQGEGPVADAVAIAAPLDEDERPAADDEALLALARAVSRAALAS